MNTSEQNDNQSWKSSLTHKLVAFLVTWNQKNKKTYYQNIVCGALPEALEQNKKNQDALDFILQRWLQNTSDAEIEQISKLLKKAIKLAKNGSLITFGVSSGLIVTGTGLIGLINNQQGTTVIQSISLGKKVPDCSQEKDCILVTELADVSDKISPDFDTGKLTVKFTANATSSDNLSIRNQNPELSEININGIVIGSFTGGTEGTPLIITFNDKSTREIVQDVVRNITYKNASENPAIGTRTVEFQLTDGDGGISQPFTTNINIIPTQNDISIIVPTAQTVQENKELVITPININAPENQKITVNLQVNKGTVKVKSDLPGGLTVQEITNNQTNNVILTGTTTKINTTLANSNGITYKGNQNFSGDDSLNITTKINHAAKGLIWPPNAQNFTSIRKNVSITVQPLNPPSVITVPRNPQRANQNTDLSITGINISDPNNKNVSVILEVFKGKLTVKTDVNEGLPLTSITNNKTQQVTLKGNINLINNTLASPNGVIYRSQEIGKDSFSVTVKDGKNTVRETVSIIVNDNPAITVPEYVMTSYGRVTKSDAINVIKSWLEVKNRVMGYPYNTNILRQYTTGKYYNGRDGSSGRLGSVRWLRNTGSYYRFGSSTVSSSGKFFTQGDDVVIDVKVYQRYTFYNREIGKIQNSTLNSIYRWTLRFEDGRWKIADSEKIG